MDKANIESHLTWIKTRPDLITDGKGEGDAAVQARQDLVMLYYGAAYRYLMACLRDPIAAEDLAQHFATRLMEGNYIKQAKLDKGRRFRDYLKKSLQNLVNDYRKENQRRRRVQPLPDDSGEFSPQEQEAYASDEAFLASLRDELLARAWQALDQLEEQTATPYATVLRRKSANRHCRSHEIAQELGSTLGKPLTETGVRQILHRAREKFAAFLVLQVSKMLKPGDEESLEELLIELQLLSLCKDEIKRL